MNMPFGSPQMSHLVSVIDTPKHVAVVTDFPDTGHAAFIAAEHSHIVRPIRIRGKSDGIGTDTWWRIFPLWQRHISQFWCIGLLHGS